MVAGTVSNNMSESRGRVRVCSRAGKGSVSMKSIAAVAAVVVCVLAVALLGIVPADSTSDPSSKVTLDEYHWTYTWTYDGVEYTTDVRIDKNEFDKYNDDDYGPPRYSQGNIGVMKKFVVAESTVTALATNLKTQFEAVRGPNPGEAQLANFVLAFVQMSIEYEDDSVFYGNRCHTFETDGSREYWAYPVQTLYYGVGDCEDTTFLCCALYHALGLDTAILYFSPYSNNRIAHVMAGLQIEDYSTTSLYAVSYQDYQDNTYLGCETTADFIGGIGEDFLGYGRFAGLYVNWGGKVTIYPV